MKKFILFLFLFLFIFSCKTTNKTGGLIKTGVKEFDYSFMYSKNILINNKNLPDLSPDISIKDSTDDIVKKKYIIDLDKIEYFKSKESVIKDSIYQNIDKSLKNSNIKVNIVDSTGDAGYYLKIELDRYESGEYNLIRNIPSKFNFTVLLAENNAKVSSMKKSYTINSDIYFPTEDIRIDEVSKRLTVDIINILKSSFGRQKNEVKLEEEKK
jgi:hypothetical protein